MRTPPGFPKHVMPFTFKDTVQATGTLFTFKAPEGMAILSLSLTPEAVGGVQASPTCALSIEDDGSALSGTQDSTVLAASTGITKTFTQPIQVAKDSVVELIATLSADTEIQGGVLLLEYMEA